MKNITSTLRTLAREAEAEERKIVGRHRKAEKTPIGHHLHRAAVHTLHTAQLAWIGLPAIFAFEIGRPAWVRFVEMPLDHLMFGSNTNAAHVEALSTVSNHFFG